MNWLHLVKSNIHMESHIKQKEDFAVGSNVINRSHILTIHNLVNFKNFIEYFHIPKDDVSDHLSLKLI